MRRQLAAFLSAAFLVSFANICAAENTLITHSVATVGVSEAQVLAYNTSRNYIRLQNDHATNVVYCTFVVAAALSTGIRIPPAGGTYEADFKTDRGAIRCISSGATTPLLISEGIQKAR